MDVVVRVERKKRKRKEGREGGIISNQARESGVWYCYDIGSARWVCVRIYGCRGDERWELVWLSSE